MAAAQRRIPVASPGVGVRATVGELGLEVIGPVTRPGPAPDSPEENDSSLVLLVTAPGVRILLTGDLEPPGQAALLARHADLRADVLKIPHHGSARQDPAFFAATGARLAIASAGQDNDYGHPAPYGPTGPVERNDRAAHRRTGCGRGRRAGRAARRDHPALR